MNLVKLKLELPYNYSLLITPQQANTILKILADANGIKESFEEPTEFCSFIPNLSFTSEFISPAKLEDIKKRQVLGVPDNDHTK